MYQVSNFFQNENIKTVDSLGPFTVLEYQKDLSVMPGNAMAAYYCNEMNVRKRQVVCDLSKAQITLQAGAMQWTVGDVNATTGIKGVGDLFGKALRGSVTGESAIKPEYKGTGLLVLEPTYKYIILLNTEEWGGSVVLDDGLFLACDSKLKQKAVARSNFSSAVAGGEGLFNLGIVGNGAVCLESPCPKEELIGNRLEWQPKLYCRTLWQVFDWFRCIGRRISQCLPRHRKSLDGTCYKGPCLNTFDQIASCAKSITANLDI